MSLRPSHACLPDSPFYLQPAIVVSYSTWYKNQPVGVNSLCNFMKVMTEKTGISGGKNYHSARKTMITKLVEKDINPLHVAQLTDHKNLKKYRLIFSGFKDSTIKNITSSVVIHLMLHLNQLLSFNLLQVAQFSQLKVLVPHFS